MRWTLGVRTPMHFLSAYLSVTNNFSREFESCRSVHYGEGDNDDSANLDDSNSSATSDLNASVVNIELRNKVEKKMISLARLICVNVHAFNGILASKIAASIIIMAREINGVRRNSARHQVVLGYEIHELVDVISSIKEAMNVNEHAIDVSCLAHMLEELSMEAAAMNDKGVKINAPSPSVEFQIQHENDKGTNGTQQVRSSPCSIANGNSSPVK